MKRCSKCGEKYEWVDANFYRDSSKADGFHSWCILCVKASCKEWRKLNPAIVKANAKGNREKMGRTYDLRKHYGITAEQYDAMLNAQGGVCAICKQPPGRLRLAVDHDHSNNRNRALERVENDPDWGRKALNYLARFIEQTVKVK